MLLKCYLINFIRDENKFTKIVSNARNTIYMWYLFEKCAPVLLG